MGPALDGLGKRLEDDSIREQLIKGGAGMPSYQHLSKEDLDALVDYLEKL
jgi:mono/diheme cytochrome c family protein